MGGFSHVVGDAGKVGELIAEGLKILAANSLIKRVDLADDILIYRVGDMIRVDIKGITTEKEGDQ